MVYNRGLTEVFVIVGSIILRFHCKWLSKLTWLTHKISKSKSLTHLSQGLSFAGFSKSRRLSTFLALIKGINFLVPPLLYQLTHIHSDSFAVSSLVIPSRTHSPLPMELTSLSPTGEQFKGRSNRQILQTYL